MRSSAYMTNDIHLFIIKLIRLGVHKRVRTAQFSYAPLIEVNSLTCLLSLDPMGFRSGCRNFSCHSSDWNKKLIYDSETLHRYNRRSDLTRNYRLAMTAQ